MLNGNCLEFTKLKSIGKRISNMWTSKVKNTISIRRRTHAYKLICASLCIGLRVIPLHLYIRWINFPYHSIILLEKHMSRSTRRSKKWFFQQSRFITLLLYIKTNITSTQRIDVTTRRICLQPNVKKVLDKRFANSPKFDNV
jgi:hypothetical protein